MTVDLEAIARRGHCEVSSLRNALPLLQQGYSPPFLARYRRDELGGIDEASLWALSAALTFEQAINDQRDQLHAQWEQTPLRDPSLGHAIRKSNSKRMLERLARRLKAESHENAGPSEQLAVRVLNPRKGDGDDFAAIADKLESVEDATAAVAGLDQALAKRLAGDPRVINAAVKWLSKHARIFIASVSDPHTPETTQQRGSQSKPPQQSPSASESPVSESPAEDTAAPVAAGGASEDVAKPAEQASAAAEPSTTDAQPSDASERKLDAPASLAGQTEPSASEPPAPVVVAENQIEPVQQATTEQAASEHVATEQTTTEQTATEQAAPEQAATEQAATEQTSTEQTTTEQTATERGAAEQTATSQVSSEQPAAKQPKPKQAKAKPAAKQKKISPRQRRRRWLVSVLKPLAGKRFAAGKLSAFQIVMLGRALRSQVAECSFDYDAAKLVAEIRRTVSGINRQVEAKLNDIVLEHEANIREAAEAAWWDELHERASTRLVGIAGDHLRKHINRGCVDASVVMSIDAVGPRTAATSIVSTDGRVLHCEDLPCQLSSTLRSQAVAKMGELIHTYHVDLIVISNGPARRACMIALSDLIKQSPEQSIRWTLADRTGADAYAGSDVANQEMRRTPRRFRAAAWLAFSVLQPAQAFAKVDPLKLRLASFQRELSDPALVETLENVVISGASRGGVDVNSASTEWLGRLPGMTHALAQAIDQRRRESLLTSRDEVLELEAWENVVESRQALPFLRVFGSGEVLDGTLIHPDDYALAKKLAKSLEIELPPSTPPGYKPPTFESDDEPQSAKPALSESLQPDDKPEVEDVTAAVEQKPDDSFGENVDAGQAEPESAEAETAKPDSSADTQQLSGSDSGEAVENAEPAAAAESDPAVDAPVPSPAAASETAADASAEDSPTQESPAQDSPAPDSPAPDSPAPDSPAPDSPAQAPADAATPQVEPAPEPVRRPRPEQAKINKCIKEWQIGSRRANQLVNWLCDPFGDSDLSGDPPALLTTMPSQSSLGPGDQVIGVVVGVMPFGVFVELAPDCSGLIHVSKVSDKFVEDLHEAVQVGDVITAWVTGIDQKKRRVALSAVSPEREAELQQQRQQTRGKAGHGGRGGDQRGRASGRPASAPSGQARGGQGRGAPAGRSSGGRPGGGRQSGGRSGDSRGRGRGRDQGRGGRRDKKPESYRVVSKPEEAPISDAMKKGDEPLRSFGDLLQFYSKEEQSPAPGPPPASSAAETKQGTGDQAATPTAEPTSDTSSETSETSDTSETQTPESDTPAAPPQQPPPSEPEQNSADDAVTESPSSSDRTPS
jgi:transcriptional accessory protein Tex/SPT6